MKRLLPLLAALLALPALLSANAVPTRPGSVGGSAPDVGAVGGGAYNPPVGAGKRPILASRVFRSLSADSTAAGGATRYLRWEPLVQTSTFTRDQAASRRASLPDRFTLSKQVDADLRYGYALDYDTHGILRVDQITLVHPNGAREKLASFSLDPDDYNLRLAGIDRTHPGTIFHSFAGPGVSTRTGPTIRGNHPDYVGGEWGYGGYVTLTTPRVRYYSPLAFSNLEQFGFVGFGETGATYQVYRRTSSAFGLLLDYVGQIAHAQNNGGYVAEVEPFRPAEAGAVLAGLDWTDTQPLAYILEPVAHYSGGAGGASASKLRYQVPVAPGAARTITWLETFTPEGAAGPTEFRVKSAQVAAGATATDEQLLDPFAWKGDTNGTYKVVLVENEVVSRDRFLAGSLTFDDGFEGVEVEFSLESAPGGDSFPSLNYGRHDLSPGAATVIHNSVDRMLNPDAPNQGSQSPDQKIWFARNPLHPGQIDFYTCFEKHGEAVVRVRKNGTVVREFRHTLTPAEDFARWIDYADATVKGRDVRFRDDALAPLMTSTDNGGLVGQEQLDNSTRALLIPLFLVVTQVEMLESVVVGGFQGIKTGVKDDLEVIELVGTGVVAVGGWSVGAAQTALDSLDGSPLQRATQLMQMVMGICETYVFVPLATTTVELSTWEGFRERSIKVWQAVQGSAKSVWAFATDGGKKILPALLGWFDDFANRMMDGGELAAYQGLPWGQDEIFQEAGATARQSAYTFGYTTGYCGEQVVAGALTGGAAVAGKLLFKETASQVGRLTLRSHFVTKSLLQHLKRTAKSALAAGVLRAEVELGLRAAAKTPLSVTDPRTIAEVLEYAVSRPNFDRLTFSVKNLIEGIQTLPRLRRLVEVEKAGKLPFQRTAQLAAALGDDASAKALANWQKILQNLLPLGDNAALGSLDVDRVEDFLRAFKLDTPEGKVWLRETLEALDGKTTSEILSDGLKVSPRIKDVYPTIYHYSDAQTLLDHAVIQDGRWVLDPHPTRRYLTPDNFATRSDAQSFLQLPKAQGNDVINKALTKGRFKCVIRTQDIADDISIPRSYRHGDDSAQDFAWLESRVIDNPERGLGGSIQFVQKKAVSVDVIDLETGQIIRSKEELLQALLN